MANDNTSEGKSIVPNSNQETLKATANLKTEQDETGFKRVPLNVNDPENQKKLVDLQWYLGIANPIYKQATVKTHKLQNGKKVAVDVKKSSFDHFEYPNVAGQTFNQWLKANFGENMRVDPKTKEVYSLVSDNSPAPQPNPENQVNTEETQPQPAPEQNPDDPENN